MPLLREVLLLRNENARMLGYSSHAASKIPCRIADSVKWIDDMLKFVETLLPYAKAEDEKDRRKVEAGAQKNGYHHDDDDLIMPWDEVYYRNLLGQDDDPDRLTIGRLPSTSRYGIQSLP